MKDGKTHKEPHYDLHSEKRCFVFAREDKVLNCRLEVFCTDCYGDDLRVGAIWESPCLFG